MPRSLLHDDQTVTITEDKLAPDFPGADPAVSYTIRSVSLAKARELRRHVTHARPDPSRRRTRIDVDRDEVEDAIFLYALKDWSGVVLDGEPVECVDEYKRMLPALIQAAILSQSQVGQTAEEVAEHDSFRQPENVR